jgi:hypothetical protein
LKKDITLKNYQSATVFGPFIQWLYTGKYTEKEGPVEALHAATILLANASTGISMDIKQKVSPSTMEWSVKAVVMAWELGEEMKSPNFQNHAMTRLLAAFSREHERPQLTPYLFCYVIFLNDTSLVRNAVRDLIMRNWGDGSIVDHANKRRWKSFIEDIPSSKDKFIDGMMLPLQERRE